MLRVYVDLFDVERVGKVEVSEIEAYVGAGDPVFFTNVKGFRGVGNLWVSRERIARALHCEKSELPHVLLNASENPIPTEPAEYAPVLANRAPDVKGLPIPQYHARSGGSMSGVVIAEYNGTRDMSFHQFSVLNEKEMALCEVSPHLHVLSTQCEDDLPIAVGIGVCPSILLAASLPCAYETDELEVASAVRKAALGEPVFTTVVEGLRVPAFAEAVILGRLTRKTVENPFVDVTGRYTIREGPVVAVDRVYHADDAVLHFVMPGGREHQLITGIPVEPSILRSVEKVAHVCGVRLTEGGCCRFHGIVSIAKEREEDAKNVVLAAFAGGPEMKLVVVVDEDINVFDDADVEWAVATRFQADRGLVHVSSKEGTRIGVDATIRLGKSGEEWKRC